MRDGFRSRLMRMEPTKVGNGSSKTFRQTTWRSRQINRRSESWFDVVWYWFGASTGRWFGLFFYVSIQLGISCSQPMFPTDELIFFRFKFWKLKNNQPDDCAEILLKKSCHGTCTFWETHSLLLKMAADGLTIDRWLTVLKDGDFPVRKHFSRSPEGNSSLPIDFP